MITPIPQHVNVKEKFEAHYRKILGSEYDIFMEYSLAYMRKAIRVNTLKCSVDEIKKNLFDRWELIPIPWCKEGFWIGFKDGKRFDIGNLKEHMLGYLYVQESASMIPPVVLDAQPGEIVLDMCSAPGSKATQISAMMENSGILVCNDVKGDRLKALGINVQRAGCTNVVITQMYGERIKMEFDRILVDAPCSGVGTIRKSLKVLQMWSPGLVEKLSRIQKKLIENAFANLKPGGTLVYSTCTLEPSENEGVVSHLLTNFSDAYTEEIVLDIKRTPAIMSLDDEKYHEGVKHCLRIHPYHNDSEGFFVAKIRKKE